MLALVLLGGCVPHESDDVVRLRVSFWSPPGLEEQIARRFEDAHPGVKVDLLVTGGRYAEKVQSMIVAGNEPDVMMVHDPLYHDWAARNVFVDLTDFVHQLHAEDPFLAASLDVFRREGRHFAVPFSSAAVVVYGNLEAIAAAGIQFPWTRVTWEEFEALGPRLSRRGGNPDARTEYLCAMPPERFFLVAFGVQCFDDPHHPRAVTIDAPRTVAAIEYWRRMHQRGWAVPRSAVLDHGESEMFRDGQLAFLFETRAASRVVRANAQLRWSLAPLPVSPTGRAAVPHLTSGLAVSRRTRHPEIARDFIRFYVSDAATAIPVGLGHIVPTRRRQALGELFLGREQPALNRHYIEPLESGELAAVAYAPGRLEVEAIVRRRFEQALSEPGVPAERIVAGLATDLRAWLERMREKGLL